MHLLLLLHGAAIATASVHQVSIRAHRQLVLVCRNTEEFGTDAMCDDPLRPICSSGIDKTGYLPVADDAWGHSCVACRVTPDGIVDGCPDYAPDCVDYDNVTPSAANHTGRKCVDPAVIASDDFVCLNTQADEVSDDGCREDPELSVCAEEDGSNPRVWATGTQCVQCVNSFPANNRTDHGCLDEMPHCLNNKCTDAVVDDEQEGPDTITEPGVVDDEEESLPKPLPSESFPAEPLPEDTSSKQPDGLAPFPGDEEDEGEDNVVCTSDIFTCPDGSVFQREGPECNFPDCPEPQIPSCVLDSCLSDIKECPDGSLVTRDPCIGCEFSSCPLCCPPQLEPRCTTEPASCCPVTGEWVCAADTDESFCAMRPVGEACIEELGGEECDFPPCDLQDGEPLCCNPLEEPSTNGVDVCDSGHACCPNGMWACSMGDDRTFSCGDQVLVNPNGIVCELDSCPSKDAKTCPDGTSLVRLPELGCEFPACPCQEACDDDKKPCPRGSDVARDPCLNCEFPECEIEGTATAPTSGARCVVSPVSISIMGLCYRAFWRGDF